MFTDEQTLTCYHVNEFGITIINIKNKTITHILVFHQLHY